MTDDQPFTDAQLAAMRPQPLVKRVRRRLRLSQAEFAARYGIPLRTLQEWEQGRREPDATGMSYLRAIDREPEAIARALLGETR